jgi:hypothetical protein
MSAELQMVACAGVCKWLDYIQQMVGPFEVKPLSIGASWAGVELHL